MSSSGAVPIHYSYSCQPGTQREGDEMGSSLKRALVSVSFWAGIIIPSQSEAVTLRCTLPPATLDGRTFNRDFTIDVNVAMRTVTEARGTFNAEVTDRYVAWRYSLSDGRHFFYKLDRVTGLLFIQWPNGTDESPCTRASGDILKD